MAITPRYSWPLPDASDAPNIPFDVNALAVAQEGTVGAIQDLWTRLGISGYRIEVRSVVVTANGSGNALITFTSPFASTPVVVITPGDVAGTTPSNTIFVHQTSSVTTTTFLAGGFVASSSVRINFIAIGPAPAVVAGTREGAEPVPFITFIIDPDPPGGLG